MGAKKKISKHPNPYILAEEILAQLNEASDTVVAETLTSHQKKLDPRLETLRKRKKGLMKDLAKRNVDLETYLVSMGANTIKYQPCILVDPDPLADMVSCSEDEEDDDDLGHLSIDDILDEIPTSNLGLAGCSEIPPCPDIPFARSVRPAPPPAQTVSPAHNKKGKRKKQKPNPNSEDSFLHVESLADNEAPFQASIGGNTLRELRRQVPDETEDTGSSLISAALLASAGIGVVSRFVSRSSASKSSPQRSSIGRRRLSSTPRPSSNPSSPVRPDINSSAKSRVQSLGFRFSSSQPFTKGDGNCMLYAIWDQLHKCNHSILLDLKTPHELRLHVCSKLDQQLQEDLIFWVQSYSAESWLLRMRKDGTWCDDVFLQIVANIFHKNVILIPLSPSSAHHAGMYLDIRSSTGGVGDPFFMLYFEEWRMAGHYQSLEPDPSVQNNKVISHFNWRMKSLSNTFHTNQSQSSTGELAPASQCPSSLVPSPSPSCPSPAPACPPVLPAPCLPMSAQLQSTRQRIESDGALSFSNIISPISTRGVEASDDQSYVTMPPSMLCTRRHCEHVVEYGKHFEADAWARWTAANDTMTGTADLYL